MGLPELSESLPGRGGVGVEDQREEKFIQINVSV